MNVYKRWKNCFPIMIYKIKLKLILTSIQPIIINYYSKRFTNCSKRDTIRTEELSTIEDFTTKIGKKVKIVNSKNR